MPSEQYYERVIELLAGRLREDGFEEQAEEIDRISFGR